MQINGKPWLPGIKIKVLIVTVIIISTHLLFHTGKFARHGIKTHLCIKLPQAALGAHSPNGGANVAISNLKLFK